MENHSIVVDWNVLFGLVRDVFAGYGVPEKEAAVCADVLLEAD